MSVYHFLLLRVVR